jgi:hypothetical protein
MTDRGDVSKAVLIRAAPQLFVADIGVLCCFFTGKLGFAGGGD